MFESTKITIFELSETIQNQLLESDKLSNSLYEKLEKDSKTQYKVLKEQIKMQKLEYCELEKSNKQQYNDLSKKLLEIYDRLNDLNNSQKKQIKANKHLSNQYQFNDIDTTIYLKIETKQK